MQSTLLHFSYFHYQFTIRKFLKGGNGSRVENAVLAESGRLPQEATKTAFSKRSLGRGITATMCLKTSLNEEMFQFGNEIVSAAHIAPSVPTFLMPMLLPF